ncbi:MAG: Phosphonoacetaldehyde reductase [Candidatus Moanabacter tarae]|uniref:Phosphonoacetaldehyde reductase n=1 Tax=Candidatus Moanibacter tarae TaxID=2200854 RepID=A0A2Z4AG94_9BACT|nr:MAG: Phosphonoacetaldehyde reductase [Candidatus Moanabacter tarae]|tara:strand:- start:4956 stop:6107 length:1152 start_codon:yes stop_codon:yes gene_type:complete
MQIESQIQDVHFGEGAIAKVSAILNQLGVRKVFLVADEPAYDVSGAANELETLFADYGIDRFSGFKPNPKLEDIQRGIQQFCGSNPDVLIAVGGGTAIDLAKLIGTLANHQADPRKMITGLYNIEKNGPPLIAIPTSAGTGSEATHFAVAYVDSQKYSVADSRLLPSHVVIDPRLTHSLPAGITAASGLDAFCQSVESIWAVGATDESIRYASESVHLALANLLHCVQHPTPEARMAMCRAAYLSGKAINISKTTAPHAISYAITTRFGLPHGLAVALTLGEILKFNASVRSTDCTDPRGAGHVQARIAFLLELLDQPTAERAAGRIQSLMESVGAPLQLRDAGILVEDEFTWIAEQVNVERLSNNPRKLAHRDIEKILQKIS